MRGRGEFDRLTDVLFEIPNLVAELLDLVMHTAQLLRHGVGVVDLVEQIGTNAVDAHDACGYADRGGVGRDLGEDDRACRDAGVIADLERSEHLGARADHHVVAEGGMALALILARTAEGDVLVDQAVVADHSGLADDDAHAVVDHQPLADGRAGMDLDAGFVACALTQPACDEFHVVDLEPVRAAVFAYRLVARVEEEYLHLVACRGIAQ